MEAKCQTKIAYLLKRYCHTSMQDLYRVALVLLPPHKFAYHDVNIDWKKGI
jgi:hypothetical protein